jgi:hypothetical protein
MNICNIWTVTANIPTLFNEKNLKLSPFLQMDIANSYFLYILSQKSRKPYFQVLQVCTHFACRASEDTPVPAEQESRSYDFLGEVLSHMHLMETAKSSKTSVNIHQTTQHHIPEDRSLFSYCKLLETKEVHKNSISVQKVLLPLNKLMLTYRDLCGIEDPYRNERDIENA